MQQSSPPAGPHQPEDDVTVRLAIRMDEHLPMLTAEHADLLRSLARDHFTRRGMAVTVDGDSVSHKESKWLLDNLAHICRARPFDQWPHLVDAHFTALDKHKMNEPPRPAEEVLRHAVLRLVPDDYMEPKVWSSFRYARPVAEGLVECIALDRPDSIEILNDSAVARVGLDALRAAGRANLVAERIEHEVSRRPDGPVVHVLGGDSLFVASKVLVLDDVIRTVVGVEPPADGALVTVPSRHHLAFHLIGDAGVVTAVNDLTRFGLNAYRDDDNPGKVSPRLYWWRAGQLVSLTVIDRATKSFSVRPPDALMDIMRRVAERTGPATGTTDDPSR